MKLLKNSILSLFVAFAFVANTNAQEAKVTDAQIDAFASIYQYIQTENMKAQQDYVTIIEEEGLTTERFNEIHTASLDPNSQSDATPEETKKHQAALAKIESKNEDVQKLFVAKIEESGMSVEQYQELNQKIQTDPELSAKLMEKFQQ